MRSLVQLAAAIALATASGLAAAVNLLPNGDFSSANQVDGWTAPGATISWNSDDAGADANSGSLQVDFVGTGTANSACFTVQAGATFTYGGQSRLAVGNSSDSFVCYSYDTMDCIGSATGLHGPIISQGGAWPTPTSDGSTLSNTAKSVRCIAQAAANPANGPSSSRYDNLFFDSVTPTTPVKLQSFSVD
jgi:hypothetical protein